MISGDDALERFLLDEQYADGDFGGTANFGLSGAEHGRLVLIGLIDPEAHLTAMICGTQHFAGAVQ